ncbi:hypothetical protein SYNPS1DRAFT_25116, partial [Syncephalis pseudoplumigaleata]
RSLNPLLAATPLSSALDDRAAKAAKHARDGPLSFGIPEQGPPAYTAKPPSPPPAYSATTASKLPPSKRAPATRLEAARLDMANTCNPTVAWHVYRMHKVVAARAQIYKQLANGTAINNKKKSMGSISFARSSRALYYHHERIREPL